VAAKGLTECPGFSAPLLVQVSLRLAIVDLETGWITTVARRGVTMANECYMASLDERGPGFIGITGGHARRET
jgi:hypothetical protein